MLRQPMPTALALTAAILWLAPTGAGATSSIRNTWLVAYPEACQTLADAANSCTLCHGGGFARNNYAQDYKDNGEDWIAIEGLDSDGDTVANGQEIEDCTLPGDPTSVTPNDEVTWGAVKALFR